MVNTHRPFDLWVFLDINGAEGASPLAKQRNGKKKPGSGKQTCIYSFSGSFVESNPHVPLNVAKHADVRKKGEKLRSRAVV